MTFELKTIKSINVKTTMETDTNKLDKYQFILKMVKSGVHFGHKVKKWNPRMAPFIYQKLQGIHIIDIIQSYTYLKKVCKILYTKASSSNYSTFLFVGTQKQSPIPNCINYNASKCNSFFIDNKWLSGMLTNWSNTNGSINTLKYLQMYRKTKNFNRLSMKLRSMIEKKHNKLEKYFGGIKNMTTLPDMVILVGQHTEITASKECKKLGISNVTILDTDCNPDLVDLFIPGNDDSTLSIQLILNKLAESIYSAQTKK